MKKALAVILSLCIAVGASGCGAHIQDDNIESQRESTVTVTSAQTEAQSQSSTTTRWSGASLIKANYQAAPTQTTTEETVSQTTTTTTAEPVTTTTKKAVTTTVSATKKVQVSKVTTTTAKAIPAQADIAPSTTEKAEAAASSSQADTSSKLFYIAKAAAFYKKDKTKAGTIYAGSLYSGRYDPRYPGFAVINYLYGEYLINKVSVKEMTGAKILPTAAIGQMGGSIYGLASCGPTAATILVNSQLGLNWNKDKLILYCESKKLNDQGSLRYGGGITAPKLIKAINGYSGGKVTAKNIYAADPASILKKQIDAGNRSIVVVQYTSGIVTHHYSGTHFVVICGYEYIGGKLYFYYADPYYGNGGRSLLRIKATTLAASMNMVAIEPRCIITVSQTK